VLEKSVRQTVAQEARFGAEASDLSDDKLIGQPNAGIISTQCSDDAYLALAARRWVR
jgi:hypothetical protein